MTAFPGPKRFVTIRLPVDLHPAAKLTLSSVAPGEPSPLDEHPVLVASEANLSPMPDSDLKAWVDRMLVHEQKVFDWLSNDPGNTLLFLQDPMTALTKALPNIELASIRSLQGASTI